MSHQRHFWGAPIFFFINKQVWGMQPWPQHSVFELSEIFRWLHFRFQTSLEQQIVTVRGLCKSLQRVQNLHIRAEHRVTIWQKPLIKQNQSICRAIVFCCIAAWIQLNISTRFSCCLKMKSVENILGYIREAVSLEKIFKIVQENTLKCSKLIHF